MSYDASFDSTRLKKLTEKLLSETSVSGDIFFVANVDDYGVDGATWRFKDDDYHTLTECGFKSVLMALLDTLIRYRAYHRFTDTLCGVVHLENSSASIEWLTEEEVEKLSSVK